MMKRFVRVFFIIFLFIGGFLSITLLVEAKSITSTVYIAGNPSLTPIEYYDSEEKCYQGILPDIYKQISEKTGINFIYISPGTKNEQQRLAKNRQVEMVSAHLHGTIDFVTEDYTLVSYWTDGQEQTICIGFTEIASQDTVHVITEQLKSISDGDLLKLLLSQGVTKKDTLQLFWCVIMIIILTVAALMLILYFWNHRAMKQQQNMETVRNKNKHENSLTMNNQLDRDFSDEQIPDKESLRGKLLNAISNHEFKVYLQFIIDAKTGLICGAEALSRWQHPEKGLLTPDSYIEDMNAVGIIECLDFSILKMACQLLEEWNSTEKGHLWLSCNFTRLIVSQKDFLEHFFDITNQYVFERKNLIIELTEDTLADNIEIAYKNILTCKRAGFKIALDDLGSGYSSFHDLCDYPVDIIKIDRELITKSLTSRGSALIKGMSKFAHDLGMQVLCEGVENKNEEVVCTKAECDYIQGFLYSKVLSIEVAMKFYEESKLPL